MPRKSPDTVQETRITFGNYERQFVKEIKSDVEKVAKVALIAPAAVAGSGLMIGVGVGALGWFTMKGLQGFALGLPDISSPFDNFVSKWFYFTNSETGEQEAVLTNWYDYVFNNREYEEAVAKSAQKERATGRYDLDNIATNEDGSVWSAPGLDIPIITPDEKQTNTNTGGKGTADDGKGSNWPFTEDWWPF